MGPGGVVVVPEPIEQGLQLADGGRWVGLGPEPFLHRLLEAFDLAAGGGVVRPRVFLHDVVPSEFVFEMVASAAPAGVPGGEHHPVIGQHCGWESVCRSGFTERGEHDRPGDADVGADVQGVAGVVIKPGQDLGVPAVGQPVVGEIGLPCFVGLRCLEPDVGTLGPLARLWGTAAWVIRIRWIVARETRTWW